MKIKYFLSMVVLLLVSMGVISANNEADKGNYIKVIYFHGDYRCPTCNKLEAYTKESLDKFFSQAAKEGKIKWSAINFDRDENEHYMTDYKLYNKSVIIARYEKGKQKEWKNLEKIWEKVGDKDEFLKYIKKEVKEYLGKL